MTMVLYGWINVPYGRTRVLYGRTRVLSDRTRILYGMTRVLYGGARAKCWYFRTHFTAGSMVGQGFSMAVLGLHIGILGHTIQQDLWQD